MLAVDPYPARAHVLLDPGLRQPGRGQSVAHRSRGGLVAVTPSSCVRSTDSSAPAVRLVTVNAQLTRGAAGWLMPFHPSYRICP